MKSFLLPLFFFFSLYSNPLNPIPQEMPLELKVDLFRFTSSSSSLSTHYEKKTFFDTTFFTNHVPETRAFWGADIKIQIPLQGKNTFSKTRFFSSKRRLQLTDYSGYVDPDAIGYHYDVHRSYCEKNILLTTAQNGYLFNEELIESSLGTKFFISKHLLFSLSQGLQISHFLQSLTKKIGFFYLENAPVEELRNFNSSSTFHGAGPLFCAHLDFTPFPTHFFTKTLHFFSQIDTCMTYGKYNVLNQFYIDNGSKKITLLDQLNTTFTLIPVLTFLVGIEFRPNLIFFEGSFDMMIYNQTWLNADRSYQGTLDFNGRANISLTGYAIGIGLDF